MTTCERTRAGNDWRPLSGGKLAGTAAKSLTRNLLTLGAVCLLASSTVSAQTLDDFRTAAAGDGVNVIPFPDLRRDATSIADEVERRKQEATKYNIDVLTRQKDNLLSEVKKTQEAIKQKEEEIDDFKRDHPDGSAAPLEKELEDLKSALTKSQEEVQKMNSDVLEDAVDAWERLWNARAGLREKFEDVVKKLDEPRSSPEHFLGSSPSDEDIDKLKKYVDVIENEIEVQAKEHLVQENGAKATQQAFSELLKKNES